MNKYLVATLFITLLLGNTFAASTCEGTGATAGTNNGNYDSADHSNCVLTTGSEGYCATGYTDNSGAAATSSGSLTGDCDYCASGYIFDSAAHTTCVSSTYASGSAECATGYSDVAPSSGENQAATATGTITGDCDNCAPDYIWGEAGHTSCVQTCATGELTDAAGSECGTVCLTGYSDVAPASGSNTAATTGGTLTGQCKYCAPNYIFDSAVHDNCVSTTYNVNTAKCATMYSDVAPVSGVNQDATASGTITGDCDYCAPDYYYTSTANDECGQACKTGFQTADGQTGASTAITADCSQTTPTSSGNFLTYSVVVILAIVSLLF